VTDFGIAKTTSRTWSTQAGYVIGSPSYMSPEQCLNRDVDGRSDLYSLGVVLYQMATGNLPFKGKDVATVIYQHVHEEPLAPDIYEPGLPAWLKDIILRCLDKDPDSRFRNAREFCQALANKSPAAYPGSKPQVSAAADLPIDHKRLKWLKPNLPAVALLAAGGAAAAVDLRIAAVLFSIGGGLACYRCFAAVAKKKKEKKILTAQDDQAFKKAERINSVHAYRSYLKSYPNGLHAGTAIDELSFKEAKITNTSQAYRNYLKTFPEGLHVDKVCARLDKLDNKAFDQASETGTEDSYLDYLAKWPEGRHGKEAKEKLEKIVKAKAEQEASKQEEEKQFRQALLENKVSSYKKYLADFPEGLHAEEARDNLHELLYKKSLSSSTRKWCEDFLKTFPESEYRPEVRSRLTIIVKREEKEKLLGSLGIEMVSIPGGTFIMGSEDGADDAKPLHRVRLSGFKLSSTVITQSQYWEVLEEDPSCFKGDKLPVENVSYHDAMNFCNRLSEKTGQNLRLPTEAEWEYACRAGTSTRFSSGGDLANVGWFRANSRQKTQPVGLKAPNEWELYDMHGNVWEWCSDWYDPGYYRYSPNNDPRGPDSGSSRVLRGGSWKDLAISCCSGARLSTAPATRTDNIGFRIVRV
ncbi:MAG: SUMF1/EgtB/PvdO family nonheme iron enzyme, partial [Candidatus Glassbacteria bacterium]|nr:SUMF1/EgtB/PvdO family nonheme iron enzyme [Candidatus Glassbacteria bacterium]